MKLFKRTFEARRFPAGSAEREKLNASAITSEYMPSYKFQVMGDHFSFAYRTRREAEDAIARMSHAV